MAYLPPLYEKHKEVIETVMDFIYEYRKQHGYMPTSTEICVGLHFNSYSSFKLYWREMFEYGYLETEVDWHIKGKHIGASYRFGEKWLEGKCNG